MAVTSPVVCARSLCREALTRTHMHVKHRTGMAPPFLEGGSAAAARVSWKLVRHCQDTPRSIHTQLRARLALEILIKIECGAAKMEGALGVQPSRVQKEPFTDEEIQGSMRAGQSPNCPKINHEILAPILARGAEPRPLLAPPTPDPLCLSLKQDSYPGHTHPAP